jgi:2-oxoglutarate ferredoxin oxidoreductase subunit alpha
VAEARDLLGQAGIESSYLRLRALPINQTVRDFLNRYEKVFVVENNHDGQLCQILLAEEPLCDGQLISVARCNGLPLAAQWIAEAIQQAL